MCTKTQPLVSFPNTEHTLESSSLLFNHKVLLCFVKSLSSLPFVHPSTVCLLVINDSPFLSSHEEWSLSVDTRIQIPEDFETSASRSHRILELFNSLAKESCTALWLIANYWEANRNANPCLDYLSGHRRVTPTPHI